ncbi:hypothetical protein K402DRAFT_462682 [Aulographum hederae CBS 113979]|uniref:Uncharacterized protein n=1 Tax=Aulographum hederae CBS 113979 TaxID=1176131 RepID=A0A6G1H3V5_9PEZI|nr:hypothetical protein K402DRAFT_462682 [Aulographum hederae CBS 113979]
MWNMTNPNSRQQAVSAPQTSTSGSISRSLGRGSRRHSRSTSITRSLTNLWDAIRPSGSSSNVASAAVVAVNPLITSGAAAADISDTNAQTTTTATTTTETIITPNITTTIETQPSRLSFSLTSTPIATSTPNPSPSSISTPNLILRAKSLSLNRSRRSSRSKHSESPNEDVIARRKQKTARLSVGASSSGAPSPASVGPPSSSPVGDVSSPACPPSSLPAGPPSSSPAGPPSTSPAGPPSSPPVAASTPRAVRSDPPNTATASVPASTTLPKPKYVPERTSTAPVSAPPVPGTPRARALASVTAFHRAADSTTHSALLDALFPGAVIDPPSPSSESDFVIPPFLNLPGLTAHDVATLPRSSLLERRRLQFPSETRRRRGGGPLPRLPAPYAESGHSAPTVVGGRLRFREMGDLARRAGVVNEVEAAMRRMEEEEERARENEVQERMFNGRGFGGRHGGEEVLEETGGESTVKQTTVEDNAIAERPAVETQAREDEIETAVQARNDLVISMYTQLAAHLHPAALLTLSADIAGVDEQLSLRAMEVARKKFQEVLGGGGRMSRNSRDGKRKGGDREEQTGAGAERG